MLVIHLNYVKYQNMNIVNNGTVKETQYPNLNGIMFKCHVII